MRPMAGLMTARSATKVIASIAAMHMTEKWQLRCPGGLASSPTDHLDSLAAV